MTRFPLIFEHFELAQRWCQVPSGDIAFSDDAQVLLLYQWLFSAFGMELLQVAFSVLEHPSCITQYLQKPPIWQGLYTSQLHVSNHKGWQTSFLEYLSFLLTTVLKKKFEYDGGGLKWFLGYLIFSWDWRVLVSTLPLTMSPTSKYSTTCW